MLPFDLTPSPKASAAFAYGVVKFPNPSLIYALSPAFTWLLSSNDKGFNGGGLKTKERFCTGSKYFKDGRMVSPAAALGVNIIFDGVRNTGLNEEVISMVLRLLVSWLLAVILKTSSEEIIKSLLNMYFF
jgi:hypothetical protein